MPKRNVVVIGASAGGVEALSTLMGVLPPDLPATLLVVLHVPPTESSALPKILSRYSALRVKHAEEGDRLESGRVLVAPPDRHLIVYDDAVTLSRGPKENGHRPAVDVLFRSAAATHGPRVVAVVLSGALDDGAAGMLAVKQRGGLGIAQDAEEALQPSMPLAAASVAPVDHVLPIAKIADLLARLVEDDVAEPSPAPALMEMEAAVADMDTDALTDEDRPGTPSGWSCPDCHGSLFEIRDGDLVRFRCRVGHAWSPDSLLAQQTSMLEGALWASLRALEEKVTLSLELGRQAEQQGHELTAAQFARQAEDAQRAAGQLKTLIERVNYGDEEPHPVEADVEEPGA